MIGAAIRLNGYRFTVVGVAPPEFTGTIPGFVPDVYVPVMMQGQVSPGWKLDPLFGPRARGLAWLEMMGRDPTRSSFSPTAARDSAPSSVTCASPCRC